MKMKDNQTLVIVGDTHSQHQKIEAVFSWCEKEVTNPYYLWLGDVMDSRLDIYEHNYPPYSDPKIAFELVQYTVLMGEGVLLQSNHQDKLRRWLWHHLNNPEKKNPVTVNYGLDYTLAQLVEPMTIEEKWDLHNWLAGLPYHIVLESYDLQHDCQTSFLCSHAYFNTAANLSEPSKRHKQEALYGLLDESNQRVDWWSEDNPISFYGKTQEYIRVAGHYHILHKGLNNRVLDAGCGSTGGSLCVHVPAYDLYQLF